ncbi:hypothetical protein E4U55_007597 [Claviceps digitariae]|nr:hypothetical protein E4U55_007597 [Claviceps digitariae]
MASGVSQARPGPYNSKWVADHSGVRCTIGAICIRIQKATCVLWIAGIHAHDDEGYALRIEVESQYEVEQSGSTLSTNYKVAKEGAS